MRPLREPVQEPYVRTREHPFFNGLLRNDSPLRSPSPSSVVQDSERRNVSRSVSDLVDTREKASYNRAIMDLKTDDSVSVANLEPFGEASIESWSKLGKEPLSASREIESVIGLELENSNYLLEGSNVWTSDAEETRSVTSTARHSVEKSFSLKIMKSNLSQVQLPESAASFYHGGSPIIEIVETSESINTLNSFLTSRKANVSAGVPGRFLHAVIGQDTSDVASVVATIMYAFYLNETLEDDQLCTVPVINMKRADLSHAELKWLLDSCQIDQSSLIFIDEIDLSYYDLFGSLKLVLLNSHKLPSRQETLKEAVVEIFNCTMGDSVYPWVDKVTMGQESSCCTLVAEKFAMTSPEILAGRGFSRLLLSGILLDTANLTSTHCTDNDKYMSTLLLNGAGRFGCNGLYQILRHKKYDVSDLRIVDILQKDFKKWARAGKLIPAGSRSAGSHTGMSSIGIPVEQLLAHEDYSIQEIKLFQQREKLRLLVIVSGYYDARKNFKREMLISAESVELMRNLLLFLNSNATRLPLKPHQQGLREDMRAFEIDKVTSRKTIECLMDEFMGSRRSTDGFLGSSRRSTDGFLGSRRSTEVLE